VLRARFHLGQPVVTGKRRDLAVLRVALGGPLIVQLTEDTRLGATLEARIDDLERRFMMLRHKLEFLAQNYSVLAQTLKMDALGADQ
jgi:hypothetical protein